MADLVKKIKIKKQDGTFTDYIPIGAEAKNVEMNSGKSVETTIGTIDVDNDGSVSEQLQYLRYKTALFNPEDYAGTDAEKLQAAIDAASTYMVQNGEGACVVMDKMYKLGANDIITFHKPSTQDFLFFDGHGSGGIELSADREDMVFELDSQYQYTTSLHFFNVIFQGKNHTGILFDGAKFINIYFTSCHFIRWPQIAYTEEYVQNVRLLDCDIRAGAGHLFEVGGTYDLHISHCTIEHRQDGYLIYQMDNHNKTGRPYTYNCIFFASINNCLIEGFNYNNDVGLVNFNGGGVDLFEFIDNYVDLMHNYIQINFWSGAQGNIIFERNRVFKGSSDSNSANAVITCNTTNYGIINFNNNRLQGIAAIDFKQGFKTNRNYTVIFNGNTLVGETAFSSPNWSYKNWTPDSTTNHTNLPFNIVPLEVLSTPNEHCQYKRVTPILSNTDHFWIYLTNFKDRLTEDTHPNKDKNNLIDVFNGRILAKRYKQFNSFASGETTFYLSFGVPNYSDDQYSISIYNTGVATDVVLKGFMRAGSYEDKDCKIIVNNLSENASGLTYVIATVECTGIQG